MPDTIQNINPLRQRVEESANHRIKTSTNFTFLSGMIQERLGDTLGPSTLKRIWGYVEGYASTRESTLVHLDGAALCGKSGSGKRKGRTVCDGKQRRTHNSIGAGRKKNDTASEGDPPVTIKKGMTNLAIPLLFNLLQITFGQRPRPGRR